MATPPAAPSSFPSASEPQNLDRCDGQRDFCRIGDKNRLNFHHVDPDLPDAVRSRPCNGGQDAVETSMSPLSMIQKRTQRQQRLEGAGRQMAKAEGCFDLEVNSARIAPAPLYDLSYRAISANWL